MNINRKIAILLAFVILKFFSSCSSIEERIKMNLNNELNSFNNQFINFRVNSVQKEGELINVAFEIEKPYIIHVKQQLLYINYFVSQSSILKELDEFNISYYISKEKKINVNTVYFNSNKVDSLNNLFNLNVTYNKSVDFIKNNFDEYSVFSYDYLLNSIYAIYPKKNLNIDFLSLLKKLSKVDKDNLLNDENYQSFKNLFLFHILKMSDTNFFKIKENFMTVDSLLQNAINLNKIHLLIFGSNFDINLDSKSKHWESYQKILNKE